MKTLKLVPWCASTALLTGALAHADLIAVRFDHIASGSVNANHSVMRATQKLTAFLELESEIRVSGKFLLISRRAFCHSRSACQNENKRVSISSFFLSPLFSERQVRELLGAVSRGLLDCPCQL